MKILQIQRIIPNLLFIIRVKNVFSNFELQTKNNTINQKRYIYPLTKTRNCIFKNDVSLYLQFTKNTLHYHDLL